MAIYYCDFYNGNDSNNGLTSSTPKKTLNAATALVMNQSSEVRVRGWDNPTINVGNISWRKGYITLTGTTDMTSSLSVGDYIFKSTDIVPEPYKISARSFTGGVMYITIIINSGTYQGTTEQCDLLKIITGTTAAQSVNKPGYFIGTENDYKTRTGTTLSGGWDETYTNRTGYTYIFNNNLSLATKWDSSYFIVLNGSYPQFGYCNSHHLVVANTTTDGMTLYPYMSITNCVINCQAGQYNLTTGLCTLTNCIIRGGYFSARTSAYNNVFVNCKISNGTYCMQGFDHTRFIGCTIQAPGYVCYSSIYNIWSGNTIYAAGRMNETGSNNNIWINNILEPGSSTIAYGNGVYINNGFTSIQGLTPGFPVITDNNLNSYPIPTSAIFAGDIVYQDSNGYFCDSGQVYYYMTVNLKDSINNMICFNTATIQTTGITYSGVTGLKITQHTSSYEGIAGSVEFFVSSGQSYNSSFWIKSSNNQTFSYNYFLNDSPIYTNWITGTTSSSTWGEKTLSIPGNLINNNGILQLYIKFNSGTGHYVYISNISLT